MKSKLFILLLIIIVVIIVVVVVIVILSRLYRFGHKFVPILLHDLLLIDMVRNGPGIFGMLPGMTPSQDDGQIIPRPMEDPYPADEAKGLSNSSVDLRYFHPVAAIFRTAAVARLLKGKDAALVEEPIKGMVKIIVDPNPALPWHHGNFTLPRSSAQHPDASFNTCFLAHDQRTGR